MKLLPLLMVGLLMSPTPTSSQDRPPSARKPQPPIPVDLCPGGVIGLTIDDGPGPDTPLLLDALKAAGLKATFFLIGANVAAYPIETQRIIAEGHVVGNHTYTHSDVTVMSRNTIDWEIEQTQLIIQSVAGVTPTLFRQPFGATTPIIDASATAHGLSIALWTQDTEDYTGIPAVNIANQVTLTQSGGNALMHNWASQLPAAIAMIGSYMNSWPGHKICHGRLVPTTIVSPVDDWLGRFFLVHAVAW